MMNKLYLAIITCFIFILPQISFSDEPVYTKDAKSEGDVYRFQVGDWSYGINNNGKGCRVRNNGQKQDLKLPLDEHCYYVVGIKYAQYSNDLLLVYTEECGGESAFKVLRLDGESLYKKWIMHIPAFNVSSGTIRGSHMYVAAIGFVSKINLEKGTFVWEYDRLYDRDSGSFNSFEAPIMKNNEIIFREEITSRKKGKSPREIVVDDKTGKITIK